MNGPSKEALGSLLGSAKATQPPNHMQIAEPGHSSWQPTPTGDSRLRELP